VFGTGGGVFDGKVGGGGNSSFGAEFNMFGNKDAAPAKKTMKV
jgi:hypothetical protein